MMKILENIKHLAAVLVIILSMGAKPALANDISIPVSTFGDLSTAVNSGLTRNKIILIDTVVKIDELVVPHDRKLQIVGKGGLYIAESGHLLLNGGLVAPLSKVFHGKGSVVFGKGSVSEVFPEWWGDDLKASQEAINSFTKIRWSKNKTYNLEDISIPSFRELVIEGFIQLPENAKDGSSIFRNSDPGVGNTNITIHGNGTLSGNKHSQRGKSKQSLVYLENCNNVEFSVRNIGGNYFPINLPSGLTGAAVYVVDSKNVYLHDSTGRDYGRECFWLKNCEKSKMRNLYAYGGSDSWSGFQFSGADNIGENLYSENAGASGISFDCRNSVLKNVTVKNNRYFNGINFGHPNLPAIDVKGTQLSSSNSSQFGISVVNGSKNVTLDSCEVATSGSHCYNISANANNVTIVNSNASGCGGNGVNAFNADIKVIGSHISGAKNYGISTKRGALVEYNNIVINNERGSRSIN